MVYYRNGRFTIICVHFHYFSSVALLSGNFSWETRVPNDRFFMTDAFQSPTTATVIKLRKTSATNMLGVHCASTVQIVTLHAQALETYDLP